MNTKKEVKDLIIDVLDEHARSDSYKLLDFSIIHFFDTLEENKQSYEKVKEEYNKWANSDYYDGKPTPDEMTIKVGVAEMNFFESLKRLYDYLIGAEKYGE